MQFFNPRLADVQEIMEEFYILFFTIKQMNEGKASLAQFTLFKIYGNYFFRADGDHLGLSQ
ncbi:hypothetical protein [Persicobacter sp. CCB-QB2]|nr:hypothetical protein [Persicobacter sp. CCB-QB2]